MTEENKVFIYVRGGEDEIPLDTWDKIKEDLNCVINLEKSTCLKPKKLPLDVKEEDVMRVRFGNDQEIALTKEGYLMWVDGTGTYDSNWIKLTPTDISNWMYGRQTKNN
jgi:hypothetical protein